MSWGVITLVTLRCVPAFRLEEICEPMRFDEALDKVPDLAAREEFVKLWWLPHTESVQVFRYRRTEAPSRFRRAARWVDEAIVNRCVFALLLRAGRIWPALIPKANRLVRAAYFRPRRTVASSHQALTLAMPPSHQEIEYALPRELAAESLRRTRALVERDRLRVNFIAELRFVAGDDAWMSPDYRRDSAHLGAYMASAPDLPRYFSAFEARVAALRPVHSVFVGPSGTEVTRGRRTGMARRRSNLLHTLLVCGAARLQLQRRGIVRISPPSLTTPVA